jgi:hypothetical protein
MYYYICGIKKVIEKEPTIEAKRERERERDRDKERERENIMMKQVRYLNQASLHTLK